MKNNYFTVAASTLRLNSWRLLCLMALIVLSSRSYGQVAAYTFGSTTDAYTPITTGGILLGDTASDDQTYTDPAQPTVSIATGPGIPIGFNFNFGGYSFDRIAVNANGWISLGNSSFNPAVNMSGTSTPLSSTVTTTPPQLRARIVAYALDLQANGPGTPGGPGVSGNIRVVTTGTAPNRTLVVQWTGYRRYNTTNGENLNFQIRLNETSNTVQLVYGLMNVGASHTPQVGLGGISAAEFNNRTSTTSWTTTTAGTANNATMTISPTVSIPSGLTYTFTPPAAGPITSAASGLWSSPATWTGGIIPHYLSDVVIADGHIVTFDVPTSFIPSLTVGQAGTGASLRFNAAATRVLTVTGNITVTPGDTFSTVPTTGTSGRSIFLSGNFINNGFVDLTTNATILVFNSTTGGQSISGTGTFNGGNTIREIQADNGLTINAPINISARFTLINGLLTTNGNLTMDNTLGGVVTGGVNFRRSVVSPAINGVVNVGPTAAYNLDYVFFTGQTAQNCTTSTEIPTSRSINGLRYSVGAGFFLFVNGGNLTLTSASASATNTFPNSATEPGALILGGGRVIIPSGNSLIFGNGALPNVTTGSATAYVQGRVTWTVTNAAAQTRNFRIGDANDGFLVVLGGFIPGTTPQTYTAELTGAPSGSVVAPVTSTLGRRGVRITASSPLSSGATVQLNWSAFDTLVTGNINQIRVVQAPALNGAWTERSAASGSGVITATGSRTTTAGVNLANGEFFAFGTVSPGEVTVTAITEPTDKGCFSANETVRAVIRNTGTTFDRSASNVVVKGTVTSPTGTVTPLATVTRNTGSFVTLTNDTITFTTPVNMVDTGNYIVRVFIDTIAGQFVAGDTLSRTIRSAVYTATVNPGLILTTQSANLRVSTNDLGVYAPNSSLVRMSEVISFRTGTGAGVYPAYIPAAATDFLELTNFGDTAQNIGGWGIEIFNTGPRTYTFPAGVIIPANSVLVLHLGPGTDDPANRYYNTGGSGDLLFSTSAWGMTLRNAAGTLIDAVTIRAYSFPTSTGVTAADWSGTTATTSSAGFMLVRFDNNSASNWVLSTATNLTNIGVLNPGIFYSPATVAWSGPGGFTASGFTASTGPRNNVATETYTATITSNGCSKTASVNLQVVAPVVPIAGFRVSADTTTTGGVLGTVTLTDTSLNVPFTRRWTITPNTVQFVNNTNDSAAVAQVQFLQAGSYSIKLRVANPAGADSLTRNNAVFARFVYCPSNASNTGDTKIDTVIIGNTTTGSADATCETYTDHSGLGVVASLTRSFPFPIQVKNGHCGTTHYPAIMKAYVDVNKDGSFTENERVAIAGPTAARAWNTLNLVVPATADTGVTRLRIVLRETTVPADVTGCGPYPYGETEDYTVRILAPALTNFDLVGPVDSIYLNVDGQSTQTVSANWQRSIPVTGSVTYAWQLAARAAGNFNAPLATLASNNNGADTMITLTYGAIDQLMASLGVAVGDTVRGIWRVRAVRGTDTLYSLQTYDIDLRRGAVIFNCPITAVPTNIQGDTVCLSGSATLSATAPGPQDVVWYNPNNTIGAVGSSISTGTISTTTAFQVGLGNAQNGNQAFGPISPTTGTFPAGNFTNGMYYTVLANIRVDSVTFFTNGARAGAMQVWDKNPLEDPTAVILQIVPWNIPGSGVQRVPVKMYLTPGRYYINNTYGAGTGILFRTTGGATFPYELAGKIRLDSSWLAPGSNLGRIYYFFDMRISDACFGPTAPATVTVEPAPAATLPYNLDLEGGIPCNYINAGAWQQGTAASLSGPSFTIPAPASGTGIAAAKSAGRLISPSFDFSTLTASNNVTMSFNAYNNGTNGSKAYVEVSLDSGATFIRIDSVAAGAAWQTKTVSLSAYAGRPSVHFALNHAIQGGNGSGFAVDNIAINSSCGAAQVVVRLVTDIYGSEITWALTDSATGNLIAAGGPYPDVNPYNAAAATHVDTFCVPVGARLKFRINDSYGDGLWDGTRAGTYSVSLICPAGLVTLFAGADSLPYGGPGGVAPSWDSAFVNTTCFIPDTLSVFNLLTPANNSAVTLSGAGSQTVNFTWEASAQSNGNPVTYTWSLETTNLNPQTLMSRSGLTSPNVNVDYLAIADTLQRRGVAVGGTFNGRWKVVASSGTQIRDAVARFNIAITRGVITSVEENALARAMQLYPNPATNSATLAYNLENAANLKVTIVNAIGQEVMTLNEASALRGELALDLAGLKEGLYFVRISDGNELAVKRLMIQR